MAAQAATQTLVNPSFETGSFSGWTTYGNNFVDSTNNLVYNGGNPVGASNALARAGAYTAKSWGNYSGGPNQSGFRQDVIAGPGSVWSADGWALSHEQDLMAGGNTFWLEVQFLDATGTTTLGLWRSGVLDSTLTMSTWHHLSVTNQVDLWDGQTITNTASTFTAPAGTAKVRFVSVYRQTGYDGGSMYCDDLKLMKIAGSDPEISSPPVSQTRTEGQTATLAVTANGSGTLRYQWQKGAVDLSNGGNVSGANGPVLTLSSLTAADAGSYTVIVSNNSGALASSAQLKVRNAGEAATNLLINPGFEDGVDALPWETAWVRFNGGGLQTTNGYYYLTTTPISVFDGLYVSQTYASATWNGIYQDVPASPGGVYTFGAWLYVASVDPISGANACWLELQFQNAAGNMIGLYESPVITSSFTTDTWTYLSATNIIAFWGDYSVVGSATYPVAPAGTAKVRAQVTLHGVGGGGSIWYDDMNLRLVQPVAITPARSGANIQLSFPTQISTSYQVLYKNDLSDAQWTLVETVPGDGSVKTVSYPATGQRRFYRVNTL